MIIRGYKKMIDNCYNLLFLYYKFYCNGDLEKDDYGDIKIRILHNIDYFYSKISQRKLKLLKCHYNNLADRLYKIGAITQEEYNEKKKSIERQNKA